MESEQAAVRLMVLSVSVTQCVAFGNCRTAVEADVTVVTQSEQLDVDAARRPMASLVRGACGVGVFAGAVGNMRRRLVDIDMV